MIEELMQLMEVLSTLRAARALESPCHGHCVSVVVLTTAAGRGVELSLREGRN